MKRILLTALLVVLIVPAAVWAQDEELTLESLHERLAAVEERLTDMRPGLDERVMAIEERLTDMTPGLDERVMTIEERLTDMTPGLGERVTAIEKHLSPEVTEGGICILLKDDFDIRSETATKFLDAFDALPQDPRLIAVEYNVKTGRVGFLYRESSDYRNLKHVVEYWDGCEFAGSSGWIQDNEE